MKNRFSIGQMAKMHNIPVKTLRYYDEIDLFKPAEINEETGYRYYSIEQFKLLDTITYLKTLGVSLKDIKKYLNNSSLDDFILTLKTHIDITEQKIEELKTIKNKFEEQYKQIEKFRNLKKVGAPFVLHQQERKIFQLQENIQSLFDLEFAVRKLKQSIPIVAPLTIGNIGFFLSNPMNTINQYHYHSIFLLLGEVEENVIPTEMVNVLPEGKYACMYFRGGHQKTPENLRLLQNYINENNYRIHGEFIIRTVIDQYMSKHENEFLSEIQIQIMEDAV